MIKIVSFIILILLSPILFMVAIFILLEDGYPILFKQKRLGKNNNHFLIYKFRTMKNNTPDIATHLLNESHFSYTKSGPLLRKFSIDELPQLINIVKGEMTFIGPRPALHNQNDLIELRTKLDIQTLLPGITGWAQVNGRDELSIEKKVEFDYFYKTNKSILLDIKIIFLTVIKVFKTESVSL